jgi:uncharacterized protein YecT (DUF1311 family)
MLPLLVAAAPVFAQEVDCSNAVMQREMNICAGRDFDAADTELNAVWKDARAAAKKIDAELPDELRGADKALFVAQRAWIGYRDGQCELSGFEARGGSIEPMLISGCKATLTRARTKELQDFIRGPQ